MRRMCLLLAAVLLLASISSPIFSEDLPLLAVPSISAKDTAETLADTCRNMVETALIKTGRYAVLSYTDVEEILAAQAFSLSGCTDESCAIEIGELLAADKIVVGELSRLEDSFVLALRLVNVSTGMTLSAEVANISGLESLQDDVFTATFALAGLKYTGGEGIAENGGLYVTAPGDMTLEVFIDGKSYGETPVLVEEISFGVHLIEAKAGDYEYKSEISISSKEIKEVIADRSTLTGNLFLVVLPSSAKDIEITVDDRAGKTGLNRNVLIGKRSIHIEGGGWYLDTEADIETGKTTRINAQLLKAGTLAVAGPENTEITLEGPESLPILSANQRNTIPAGSWSYEITHPDFETVSGSLSLKQNESIELQPEFVHNESWELRQAIIAMELKLEKAVKTRKTLNIWGTVFSSIGGAFLLTGGTAEGLIQYNINKIETLTEQYASETDPDTLTALNYSINSSIELIDPGLRMTRDISLISGGAGSLIGGVFFLFRPNIEKIENNISDLKFRLQEVER